MIGKDAYLNVENNQRHVLVNGGDSVGSSSFFSDLEDSLRKISIPALSDYSNRVYALSRDVDVALYRDGNDVFVDIVRNDCSYNVNSGFKDANDIKARLTSFLGFRARDNFSVPEFEPRLTDIVQVFESVKKSKKNYSTLEVTC